MSSTEGLTERERQWGSTMRGHAASGVDVAHANTYAVVGAGPSLDREAREALEEADFAWAEALEKKVHAEPAVDGPIKKEESF